MISLPQGMFNQVKGVTLMAIPFFLLMGNFMNTGGVSKDLFGFARACVGHRWGGLGNAAIISCMIMSAMSGSAAAVAAVALAAATTFPLRSGIDDKLNRCRLWLVAAEPAHDAGQKAFRRRCGGGGAGGSGRCRRAGQRCEL